MTTTVRVLLHEDGPALWGAHKPLADVIRLRGSTPETIWETTYQGNPRPPAGTVFRRDWFQRYDASSAWRKLSIGRWMSWDTAMGKSEESGAFTVCAIADLMPDYQLYVTGLWRERIGFPEMPTRMREQAELWNRDEKLRGVIIEDKASGTSAYQTLMATSEPWLKGLLIPYSPRVDKVTRAEMAAVWCRNGCVLLPGPSVVNPWLLDFEDELFGFPGSAYMDQVDAFGQLVLWLENLLADGWLARGGGV